MSPIRSIDVQNESPCRVGRRDPRYLRVVTRKDQCCFREGPAEVRRYDWREYRLQNGKLS